MPQRATLAVVGYRELMRACNRGDKETKAYVRGTLRHVGDVVREDATRRFAPVDSRSAAGYRTRVRVKDVAVEQSIRKTTGKRPQYGAFQMRRALLPALAGHENQLNRELEHALDLIERHFETGA